MIDNTEPGSGRNNLSSYPFGFVTSGKPFWNYVGSVWELQATVNLQTFVSVHELI